MTDRQQPPKRSLASGQILAGRYRVLSFLGSGGMGEVWRAHDVELDISVALKCPRAEILDRPRYREWLRREVLAARTVVSPNVCRVYDLVVTEDGEMVSMEYVAGDTLAELLTHPEPLTTEALGSFARQLLTGLDAIHSAELVHRDLKPENLMITPQGRVVIMDLGIAEGPTAAHATSAGTPAYMAPEQRAQSAVDARSDVFSAAVILAQMLAHQSDPSAEAQRACLLELRRDPPRIPSSPWRPLLQRALAADPSHRYPSAGTMLRDLESLASPAPRAQRSTTAGEHRHITILSSRLIDAGLLARQLDAEVLNDILSALQDTVTAEVTALGGFVAQYSSAGVEVYFGYPEALEDGPSRGVSAALAIHRRLHELEAGMNVEAPAWRGLRVATAIHSGPVVMRSLDPGRQRGVAVGATVSVIDELQALANDSAILVSKVTRQAIGSRFTVEQWSGTGSEEVYRVLGERPAADAASRSRIHPSTPFIDRERELSLLVDCWDQATRGLGQVVLVRGDPGIGKSRLVQALRDVVSGEKPQWLQFQCSQLRANSVLHPVIDHLERFLEFSPGEPASERLTKLRGALQASGISLSPGLQLMANLLSIPLPPGTPPLDLSPLAQRAHTLQTLVEWVSGEAETRPMVLVVDDVQWSDPSTLELLGLLVESALRSVMLLVAVARRDFYWPWTNAQPVPVNLRPVPAQHTKRIIRAVSGTHVLPPSVLERIVAKVDGIPLFAEELTKSILALESEASSEQRVSDPDAELILPATLQDSLMARLDRLGPAKGVAQVASVLGREFELRQLRILSSLEDVQLEDALGRLLNAQLIHRRDLAETDAFLFKHALIRDAAYQSMTRARRRELHQGIVVEVARALPELAQASPEVFARHAEDAELHAAAVDYWLKAGRRAMASSAYHEAIRHFTAGLQQLATLPDDQIAALEGPRVGTELELDIQLGMAHLYTSGYASHKVEKTFAEAWQLCRELEHVPLPVLYGLWGVAFTRGDSARIEELATAIATHAQTTSEPQEALVCHSVLGVKAVHAGRLETAHEQLEKSVEAYSIDLHWSLARKYGDDPGLFASLYRTLALWFRGYPDRAKDELERILAEVETLGDPFALATALSFPIALGRYRGETDVVAAAADRLTEVSERQGFQHWLGFGACGQGWAIVQQGSIDQGLARVREGLELFQATGASVPYPFLVSFLVDGLLRARSARQGIVAINQALEITHKGHDRFFLAELLRLKGELQLLTAAAAPSARASFDEALSVARDQGCLGFELRAAISLARLDADRGDVERARATLAPVFGRFSEGFTTEDLLAAKGLLEALG